MQLDQKCGSKDGFCEICDKPTGSVTRNLLNSWTITEGRSASANTLIEHTPHEQYQPTVNSKHTLLAWNRFGVGEGKHESFTRRGTTCSIFQPGKALRSRDPFLGYTCIWHSFPPPVDESTRWNGSNTQSTPSQRSITVTLLGVRYCQLMGVIMWQIQRLGPSLPSTYRTSEWRARQHTATASGRLTRQLTALSQQTQHPVTAWRREIGHLNVRMETGQPGRK
jgi:hypothetical protein